MSRKDMERTPRPSKVESRVITCANCGVAGTTLVKPDKLVEKYFCAFVPACNARKLKRLCSHLNCNSLRKYLCSCGMFLCDGHAHSYRLHPGHIATPLNENLEKSKAKQGNTGAHNGNKEVELQVLNP